MLPGFRRALSSCSRLRHPAPASAPAPARPRLATVHQGVQFEERSHRVLGSQLSMSLTRVGGKSDGGVDLQGWWWLPPATGSAGSAGPALPTGRDSDPARRRLQVLGQCKAERGKLGPHYVREMEGVMLALRSEQQPGADAEAAVALLVSESGFTRGGLERARQSRVPFLLMHLPPGAAHAADKHPDAIGGCIWNAALASLLGPAFEVRWERAADPDSPASGRPGLWWNGKRLPNWTPLPLLARDDDSARQPPENLAPAHRATPRRYGYVAAQGPEEEAYALT